MSDGNNALVVLNNNNALQIGGVGLGAGMFKARPMIIELVQKTSRQECVTFGQFRVTATNEHLGESIRAVLLGVPQEQREYYVGQEFNRDSKRCFSLDGKQPHPRAAEPQAMFCAQCPKGDKNWETWRKTKRPEDLPPCGAYYHLFIADRATQTPYYLNVKGKSVNPFRQAMETQMAGLLNKLMINVKLENKQRGYTLNPNTGLFEDTPGFVVPADAVKAAPMPMPNIFDISFDIVSTQPIKGGSYVMAFRNFALMKPEDKAEFGALYLDFANRRAEHAAAQEAAVAEAVTEAANAVSETAAGPVTGTVVGKDEPITI